MMDKLAELHDLIQRLERATEPSRELDGEIALAIGWTNPPARYGMLEDERRSFWISPNEHPEAPWHSGPPFFTGNTDAAWSLIPEGWAVAELKDRIPHYGRFYCHVRLWCPKNPALGYRFVGNGATVALAVAIAGLKAHAEGYG